MKFKKQISQPGRRLASVPGSQERVWVTLTKERQQGWVDEFYKMKAKGLKVPAPFVHRQDAAGHPLTQEELKNITSRDNAGFWEDVWVDKNTDALMGTVDVPNEDDVKKIGTSIVEVSPSVLPRQRDGMGNQWENEALNHVALVTHAIDQVQPNFQPIQEEGAQMSQRGFYLETTGFQLADDSAGVGGGPISQVPPQAAPAVVPTPSVPMIVGNDFSAAVQVLQQLGLQLPPDTNQENFVERIVPSRSVSSCPRPLCGSLTLPHPW